MSKAFSRSLQFPGGENCEKRERKEMTGKSSCKCASERVHKKNFGCNTFEHSKAMR